MDNGDVKLSFDESTGLVSIEIRPPLRIEFAKAQIGVGDIIEFAATCTLRSIQRQKDMMKQLANSRPA